LLTWAARFVSASEVYAHGVIRTRVAAALLVVIAAACSSGKRDVVTPTTPPTTVAPSPASREQVKDMLAWSLPESPVFNRGIIRAHWAEVVARLPEHLPAVIPQTECETGPVLEVRLRNGGSITYECKLPPSMKTVRDYMVALVVNSS
jgi:hypothetical protein